ncbi:MAG: hypothetical protein GXP22_03105 [Gammaproteobacteria bacterium]|nr:hypothetical protein [Gammaproteobacteria bacterium]
MIIDDAFLDPDALREYAKSSLHSPRNIRNPIGYEIHPVDLNERLPDYAVELAGMIHKHIGENICNFFGLNPSEVKLEVFKGPYFNCVGVDKIPVFTPHVDIGHVSSFAYLVLPENCAGGTRIYRHIPSDKIYVLQENSHSLAGLMKKTLTEPLVESTEEWEMVQYFEMKYNRLIAFNSSSIHKIDLTGGRFTMQIEATRLCLNAFYRYVYPDGRLASRKATT